MAELGPAYLIHGDDHGAVAERRARLRALAESQGGSVSVEMLEGEGGSPAGVAAALSAMTLAIGRRVIIVDGVERWRETDIESALAPAMASMPPDTTLAMFAREEARAKVPPTLLKAVRAAGGRVDSEMMVKPWELPKWVTAEGARLGLRLDSAAAKTLVDQVGPRQQRLLRELETLALEGDSGASSPRVVGAEEVALRAAHSSERAAYALADAIVGRDGRAALALYLRLRSQGESVTGLIYRMAQRLRDALDASVRMQAGESAAAIRSGLRLPQKAAERFMADVGRTDPERLRSALIVLADLELATRGGPPLRSSRTSSSGSSEETLAVRAIAGATS